MFSELSGNGHSQYGSPGCLGERRCLLPDLRANLPFPTPRITTSTPPSFLTDFHQSHTARGGEPIYLISSTATSVIGVIGLRQFTSVDVFSSVRTNSNTGRKCCRSLIIVDSAAKRSASPLFDLPETGVAV